MSTGGRDHLLVVDPVERFNSTGMNSFRGRLGEDVKTELYFFLFAFYAVVGTGCLKIGRDAPYAKATL
jgi:hypothetical protein